MLYFLYISVQLLLPVFHLDLYIAHLHNQAYASTTVASHISAIGYIYKLNGLAKPANNFIISRLLKKLLSNRKPDIRLPAVTKDLLIKLLHSFLLYASSVTSCHVYPSLCGDATAEYGDMEYHKQPHNIIS